MAYETQCFLDKDENLALQLFQNKNIFPGCKSYCERSRLFLEWTSHLSTLIGFCAIIKISVILDLYDMGYVYTMHLLVTQLCHNSRTAKRESLYGAFIPLEIQPSLLSNAALHDLNAANSMQQFRTESGVYLIQWKLQDQVY
ncbi:hypothetical protein UY3_18295 [Chelonia mydas]|uniref:Uncharacterized protein n=1 Tax=Chelonia mydas TaxID=8469 RepID=M7AP94_CHEMY|nr:hypothetical protein UY3_18295 [Chelonia mydas]